MANNNFCALQNIGYTKDLANIPVKSLLAVKKTKTKLIIKIITFLNETLIEK